MKYILPSILTVLSAFAGCISEKKENYFTGTIEYNYSYTSDSLKADSLNRVRPSKGLFRYDTSNYQSRFIGADTFTYYYSGKLNKCLSEAGSGRQYECEDYGMKTDSVLWVKDYATDEKVLNHPCRILEIEKKGSSVKYYYATDLKIAPATYQKHVAYNWDLYGSKANGGLILKLEHRFKKFTMKGEAVVVRKSQQPAFAALEIDEALFSKICK